jgi:hypothetical protein
MGDTRQYTRAAICDAQADCVRVGHTVAPRVKSCYQTTRQERACIICGAKKKHMHMPIGYAGRFCGQCCPVCAATVWRTGYLR